MRKTFIAGNWKMNLSKQQATDLAVAIAASKVLTQPVADVLLRGQQLKYHRPLSAVECVCQPRATHTHYHPSG